MMVYTCNPSAVEMGAVLANLASCVSSRFREILSQVREGVGAWGCPLTLGWGKEGRRVGALKLLSHQAAATASSNQAAGAAEAIILPTTPLPPIHPSPASQWLREDQSG